MNMTKTVLTAMIAVSMAATVLPATAMIDGATNILASIDSATDDTTSTTKTEVMETRSTPNSSTQSQTDFENDSQIVANMSTVQLTPSPESIFQTKDDYGNCNFTDTITDFSPLSVALVSPNVTSIKITGNETLTYNGYPSSSSYTATILPANAEQPVIWSSSNENVLQFENPNSGTATIVGPGTATITATTTDGSDFSDTLNVTINDVRPTVSLKNKTTDYTGQPIEMDGAEVTLVNGETYKGDINYTYYSDAECQNRLDGAPINAGTYYVKASIPEQDNYYAAESNVATLTIKPINMPVSVKGFNGPYDGKPHGISVTGQPEGTITKYYIGDDTIDQPMLPGMWTYINPKYITPRNQVISYWVTDPNGNYKDAKGTATIDITKATPIVTLNDKTEQYSGQPIEMNGAEVTLVNGETYKGDISYTYYSDAECQNRLDGAPINAGTYYVKASIPEQDNYYAAESNVATLTIKPINMPVSVKGFNGPYDGKPHGISVTGQPEGTITKYYIGDDTIDQPMLPGMWTYINPKYITPRNQVISYWVTDPNGNYKDAKGTATIDITKATPIVTLNDKTEQYSGQPIEMNGAEVTLVNGETYKGDISYTYYSDAECQNRLDGAPINAGTYYVKASIPEQDNYYAAESNVATLTIKPINMPVSVKGFNGPYDGKPHGISVTGQPEGTITKYYIGDDTIDQPMLPGMWTYINPKYITPRNQVISYWVTDPNGNYKDAKGTATIDITKATPIVTLNDKTEQYSGQPIEMNGAEVTLVNGETYKGDISYTYYSDAECQNRLDGAPINAGTYYVKASIPEQDNYYAAESNVATLTIKPINMPVSVKGFNGPYDGKPHSISVIGQPEGTTTQYYLGDYNIDNPNDSEWIDENPSFTNVCNETVSYKITDPSGNYNEVEGIAIIDISQALVCTPITAPTMVSQTINSITLNTESSSTTPQGDTYSVQYGIDKDNTGVISWQDSATFTDLSIDTDYAFYLRYHVDEPKTDNYSNNGYSSAGPEAILSLKPDAYAPPEKAEGFTIDYIEETITVLNGYEAAIDVNFAEDTLLNTGDRITPGTVVYIRFAATIDAPPSPATSNTLSSRPATPAKPIITQTATTLTITNGTAQQEYKFEKNTTGIRSATFGVWQSSPVFTDDAMTEGDCYTITTRIKATSSSFASEGINTVYQSQSIPADNPCTDNESATDIQTALTDSSSTTPDAVTDYDNFLYQSSSCKDINDKTKYMMEITWGDMLFSYNFGEWNSENINYNDSTEQKCGWETSFDGVNNQVTVINHSCNWVDVTLNLALNENQQTPPDNLGFHLTSNNTNDNTDDYPTTAQTLQNGTVGNSTTAYVNIGADDLIPPTDYNTQTPIANITVTVQNTANS